jgi:hypothetical protein
MPFQGPSAGTWRKAPPGRSDDHRPVRARPGGQLADGVGGLGAAAVSAQGDGQAAGLQDVDVGAAVGGVGV